MKRVMALAATALLGGAATAHAQTRPDSTAGMSAAEARLSRANYESLQARYNLRIDTLRAIARAVGLRNPRIGDERLLEIVTALAADAGALRSRISELEARITAQNDPATREPALAALQRANVALNEGRLEDAEREFRTIRELRWGESEMARASWREAVEAEAGAARLRGDNDRAESLLIRAANESEATRLRSLAEAWRFDMAAAEGRLQQGRIFGDRTALDRAIAIFRERALPRVPREQFPIPWAFTQLGLGQALREQAGSVGGETGVRLLAEAAQAYREAGIVFRERSRPMEWLETQNGLANVFIARGHQLGGEAGLTQLADAAAIFRSALGAEGVTPADRAILQTGLGNALMIRGERIGGAEGVALFAEAVAAYRAALAVQTASAMPDEWALSQNNLGTALWKQGERSDGERGMTLMGQAIEAFQEVLTVQSESRRPVAWARAQVNLGLVYRSQAQRASGGMGGMYFGAARDALQNALRVFTEEGMPAPWAVTQQSLGDVYRLQGERMVAGAAGDALIANAIAAYRASLRVRTRTAVPALWAISQLSLAGALLIQAVRREGNDATASFAEAESAFREALGVLDRETTTELWANAQNGLASTLSKYGEHIGGRRGAGMLAESIAAYNAILTVYTEAALPVDWAMITYNLALSHENLAAAGTDPDANLHMAETQLIAALRVYTPEHLPYYNRRVTQTLARVRAAIAARRTAAAAH